MLYKHGEMDGSQSKVEVLFSKFVHVNSAPGNTFIFKTSKSSSGSRLDWNLWMK